MVEQKTNLNKAVGQSFELIFPKIPVRSKVRETEPFTLNIYGTVIPSLSISTTEHHWQGGVNPRAMAPAIFEPWFVNFAVDSYFENWFMIYEWLSIINNNENIYDRTPSDYWISATLKVLDNQQRHILDITFEHLFPTLLNEVSLSYREGTTNLESGVNFRYTRYTAQRIHIEN